MKKFNSKGFTLVELIVVIVIILVLAGAVVPNVMKYASSAKESKVVAECRSCVNAVSRLALEKNLEGLKPETITSDEIRLNAGVKGIITPLDSTNFDVDGSLLHLIYENELKVIYCAYFTNCKDHEKMFTIDGKADGQMNLIYNLILTPEDGHNALTAIKDLIHSDKNYPMTSVTGTVFNSSIHHPGLDDFTQALKDAGYELGGRIKGYQGWARKDNSTSGESIIFYDQTMEDVVDGLKNRTGGSDGKGVSYGVQYDASTNKFYWVYTERKGVTENENGAWVNSVRPITPTSLVSPGPFDSFDQAVAEIRKEYPNAFK